MLESIEKITKKYNSKLSPKHRIGAISQQSKSFIQKDTFRLCRTRFGGFYGLNDGDFTD